MYVPKRIVPAAPSGIVVASALSIIINGTDSGGLADGTYTRSTASSTYTPAPVAGTYNYYKGNYYLTSPGNTNYNGDFPGNQWTLGLNSDGANVYSFNPSTNPAIIPTTDWSPSITITAAPSGLSYSSTNSLNLVDASYPLQSNNYPKVAGYSNYTDDNGITTTNQFGTLSYDTLVAYNRYFVFNVTTNRWEFGVYEGYGEGGYAWTTDGANCATNPSANQNFIPTSGWSRNLVITAGA